MSANDTRDRVLDHSALNYDGYRNALTDQPLPAALVDMTLFEQNLRELLTRAGDLPLRIASKSVRCPALLRHALAFDDRCRGLMCFHMREACALAAMGFDDLLVAYPSCQPADVAAVCAAVANGASITLMVDCPAQVERIAAIAAEQGVVLPLCLDVDMSWHLPGLNFGVYRSPVRHVAAALAVYRVIAQSDAVRLEGVMGYEAQIAGLGDQVPGQALKNRLIRLLKRGSVPRLQALRGEVVAALREAGAPLRFVNGGGTGSLDSTRQDPAVTEVTAGSGLYAPTQFDHYRDLHYAPAALFALEVVRQPDAGRVTCLGGGYIASGGISPGKAPVPVWPRGLMLEPNEGAGEVQTPLRRKDPAATLPGIGDPVFFRHAKAGELCERFNHLLLIRDGRVVDTVDTYRGLGWQFV
ncbi:amino acid deaminase/aldolase [Alcanivorax sp. JB21]|uniref:amino acid deaminase/aldolase n=1 Tax=Alcanivorax limicola TaxID=2874102 RepID=UPI001CC0F459|nr:amino acid deaminase/aldolase [Alcanivorax limicola]MBZ2187906.1 amino acid deaminase/aldolase [Alcanivorax limicola]